MLFECNLFLECFIKFRFFQYKRVFDHFSRHMHNDHDSSRYRCKVCDYSNAVYTAMTNHVTLKHRHKDCKNYIEDLSEVGYREFSKFVECTKLIFTYEN